ncbi:hypothetical protein [Chroococcidiopsis sp. CCNUC1]|uniref:hypothetical protein n=1 Tax=Chroococcidiopsis sp. CCNUC1 TaxID=2653189 RepID=UPI002020011F|nr:hypothetical protein [Chroococcidiopsis sp. CCNUC1]URD50737.1 hypothetical protein M5J74_01830 [Chroococcidiopsis sp. CCNUC1]
MTVSPDKQNRPIRITSPAIRVTETEEEISIEFLSLEDLRSSSPETANVAGGCDLSGSYPNYGCRKTSCTRSCAVKSKTESSGIKIYWCDCE